MLQDVRRPGAFVEALDEAAALAVAAAVVAGRQPGGQAVVEAGQGVGGEFLQFADVDPGFEDRAVGPHVGAAQMHDLEEFDGFHII